ncbi:MAG: bifunctional tRNA (5-methylaminomethyl-2-thiouridine)(34)-methyltransferase MnmD/FAD-dependent 5-carboxymethylaminomethyl-2-thiouridine(34) oxidoreductase MnmC [Gammaproteobacteria bacterium]|nr:bifunctional tRNA (5-methylaminomethyl-2-thiouridine)(34)-methyltransferase MnmD/FAD-dependent 5-carboxymethylaminomethyl-2-thiouridine(34) oxidoreductase MnmC [Gammaproteobacteria bacterium]
MKPAAIDWHNGQPLNTEFGDVYFSTEGGIEETEYVFLKHNQLPDRWQGCQQFTIAETGFGSGLNFLTTVHHWLASSAIDATLYYYSIEKYPLSLPDLQRALGCYPEFAAYLQELLDAYPPCVAGMHHIPLFDNRVVLVLMLGDVDSLLPAISSPVDAWYLDGFAPDKNPAMWSEAVFRQVARLSKQGTSFSTYTVAGFVRRGLMDAGFEVEKCPGHGKKRQMLRGRMARAGSAAHPQPWFFVPEFISAHRTVAIVGAGIAGVTTACALARRGWQVELIEKHSHIAAGASGNPVGVLMPRVSLGDSAEAEFYTAAYFKAIRALQALKAKDDDVAWWQGGVLQLASSERIEKQFAELEEVEGYIQCLAAEQVSACAGIPLQDKALFFAGAGWLKPAAVCESLLQGVQGGVRLVVDTEITQLEYNANQWQLSNAAGKLISRVDAVVLANAQCVTALAQTRHLPVQSVRGQISTLAENNSSQRIQTAICYEGYITPAVDHQHVIGASFKPGDDALDVRDAEHLENRRLMQERIRGVFSDDEDIITGRAAIRAIARDRMPLVGAIANSEFFTAHYVDLHKGKEASRYPLAQHLNGLYVNVGHGARGLTSSFLSAEIIASQLNNEPQCVTDRVLHALNPVRFIIRDFKKGQLVNDKQTIERHPLLQCDQCGGCM